jgi:hypothetical protein
MRGRALIVVFTVLLAGDVIHSQSPTGSIILAEGFAEPNIFGGPLPDFFESWCADTEDGSRCIPTVTLALFDARKGSRLGTAHAWGKDFRSTASGTLQFKEFILYELRQGQLYTLSQDGGHPGGAFADPSLVIQSRGKSYCLAEPKVSLSAALESTGLPGEHTRRDSRWRRSADCSCTTTSCSSGFGKLRSTRAVCIRCSRQSRGASCL